MLTKLLKYDLKYMIKNMSIFYILAIISAVISRIVFSLKQTVIVQVIGQISIGFLFAMVANILINTLMRSWVRFRDSIYKDEAYLTHTLPVTKDEIYNSKFIQTLIFAIVGFIIIIISLFITYYTEERWLIIKDLIGGITVGLNSKPAFFITSMFLVIFLEVFNALQCGFFGIILGHRQSNNRIPFSVLFGFFAYLATQSLVLLITFITGLFNPKIMDLFKNNIMLDTGSFKLFAIVGISAYIFVILIMNIISRKALNKGVNIE